MRYLENVLLRLVPGPAELTQVQGSPMCRGLSAGRVVPGTSPHHLRLCYPVRIAQPQNTRHLHAPPWPQVALTCPAKQARCAQQQGPQQCDREPAGRAGHDWGSGGRLSLLRARLWPVSASGLSGAPAPKRSCCAPPCPAAHLRAGSRPARSASARVTHASSVASSSSCLSSGTTTLPCPVALRQICPRLPRLQFLSQSPKYFVDNQRLLPPVLSRCAG